MSKVWIITAMCLLGLGGCNFGNSYEPQNVVVVENIQETDAGELESEDNSQMEAGESETTSIAYTDRIVDAQLLAKYPDTYGWMENCDCGDIPYLANAAYIDKSVRDGIFLVSTPEELASFNYYVNTTPDAVQYMQLVNDIDLAGYEWAPMGWSGGTDTGVSFSGSIYGEGYTIRNLYINNDEVAVGFIGWGVYCGVWNLALEDACVKGRNCVGILNGQAIRGWYENCHVSGEVYGDDAGSLHGHSAGYDIYDCTADVTVNGEAFEFLTYNEKAISEIVIENPLTVVLNDDYSVSYTPGRDFTNLGWLIKKDGRVVEERASDRTLYSYEDQSPGTYSICLIAFVEGQYVPVSNTVEYTIE